MHIGWRTEAIHQQSIIKPKQFRENRPNRKRVREKNRASSQFLDQAMITKKEDDNRKRKKITRNLPTEQIHTYNCVLKRRKKMIWYNFCRFGLHIVGIELCKPSNHPQSHNIPIHCAYNFQHFFFLELVIIYISSITHYSIIDMYRSLNQKVASLFFFTNQNRINTIRIINGHRQRVR